ncbi:hypothetical protein ABK040_013567 [Willaertia magna]
MKKTTLSNLFNHHNHSSYLLNSIIKKNVFNNNKLTFQSTTTTSNNTTLVHIKQHYHQSLFSLKNPKKPVPYKKQHNENQQLNNNNKKKKIITTSNEGGKALNNILGSLNFVKLKKQLVEEKNEMIKQQKDEILNYEKELNEIIKLESELFKKHSLPQSTSPSSSSTDSTVTSNSGNVKEDTELKEELKERKENLVKNLYNFASNFQNNYSDLRKKYILDLLDVNKQHELNNYIFEDLPFLLYYKKSIRLIIKTIFKGYFTNNINDDFIKYFIEMKENLEEIDPEILNLMKILFPKELDDYEYELNNKINKLKKIDLKEMEENKENLKQFIFNKYKNNNILNKYMQHEIKSELLEEWLNDYVSITNTVKKLLFEMEEKFKNKQNLKKEVVNISKFLQDNLAFIVESYHASFIWCFYVGNLNYFNFEKSTLDQFENICKEYFNLRNNNIFIKSPFVKDIETNIPISLDSLMTTALGIIEIGKYNLFIAQEKQLRAEREFKDTTATTTATTNNKESISGNIVKEEEEAMKRYLLEAYKYFKKALELDKNNIFAMNLIYKECLFEINPNSINDNRHMELFMKSMNLIYNNYYTLGDVPIGKLPKFLSDTNLKARVLLHLALNMEGLVKKMKLDVERKQKEGNVNENDNLIIKKQEKICREAFLNAKQAYELSQNNCELPFDIIDTFNLCRIDYSLKLYDSVIEKLNTLLYDAVFKLTPYEVKDCVLLLNNTLLSIGKINESIEMLEPFIEAMPYIIEFRYALIQSLELLIETINKPKDKIKGIEFYLKECETLLDDIQKEEHRDQRQLEYEVYLKKKIITFATQMEELKGIGGANSGNNGSDNNKEKQTN